MELVHRIFLWIYIRPIPQLVLLILGASVLFLFARRAWGRHPLWKFALGTCLMVWAGVTVCSTVFGRNGTTDITHAFSLFHSYREVLGGGNPEILRSNFMNMVLFYPAGLAFASLLSGKWPVWLRILLTLGVFFVFSAGIEYFQYTQALGNTEVDDVLHNTLGALLGGAWAMIPHKIKRPE